MMVTPQGCPQCPHATVHRTCAPHHPCSVKLAPFEPPAAAPGEERATDGAVPADDAAAAPGDGERASSGAAASTSAAAAAAAATAPPGPYFWPQPRREWAGHSDDILDVSWSPQGKFLLTASLDKSARLWHISQPACLRTFWHSDIVTSCCFHPRDPQLFATGEPGKGGVATWHGHGCCQGCGACAALRQAPSAHTPPGASVSSAPPPFSSP